MRPTKIICDVCGKEEDQKAQYCSECGSYLNSIINEKYSQPLQHIDNELILDGSQKLNKTQFTESDLIYCYKYHYRGNPVYANVKTTVLIKRLFKLLGFLFVFGWVIYLFSAWGLILIIFKIFMFLINLSQEDKAKENKIKDKSKRKNSSKTWRCSNCFDTEIRKLSKSETYG